MKHFRIAKVLTVVGAAALVALVALLLTLSVPTSPPAAVAQEDWGHVRAYDGALMFMLAPATDERRRYELGFGKVLFTSAGAIVADDEHMTNGMVLEGKPMGKCGYFWQGPGVTVTVTVNRCVPRWAQTPNGYPAHQWIRTECLRPKPCVVVLKYE